MFYDQLKTIDTSPMDYIKAFVSVHYQIPRKELMKKYKWSEIQQMFIDLLYVQKQKKWHLNTM